MNGNYLEVLSLFVSVIAVVVSLVAIVRTRKTQKEFYALEKIHAALSAKQLEDIKADEQSRTKTYVEIDIQSGSVYLVNVGLSLAKSVDIEFSDDSHNCLVRSELEFLPYPQLNPRQDIKLVGAYNTSCSPRTVPITVKWENEDGTKEEYTKVIKN